MCDDYPSKILVNVVKKSRKNNDYPVLDKLQFFSQNTWKSLRKAKTPADSVLQKIQVILTKTNSE